MDKFRYLNTDCYVEEGTLSSVRLLQSSKAKLSTFVYNGKKPRAIINCSFFNGNYVLGRNQGDESQDTYADVYNKAYCDVVIDDEYHVGKFNNYDYPQSRCGFSPASILVKDGEDVELYSSPIDNVESIVNSKQPRTAFAITKDKRAIMFVCEGRSTDDSGLTGKEVRSCLKERYDLDMLCILDGGGSTEMIVNNTIVNRLSDGAERPMLNGIAFIEESFEPVKPSRKILYPCSDGWVSTQYSTSHTGIDFGWQSTYSKDGRTPIYACDDGEVVFEGYYPEVWSGKTYKPIGVILKHNWSSKYDYYSIYWHLDRTVIDKGTDIKKGQIIGVRGTTGNSSGVHLHFQIICLPKGMALPQSSQWKQYSIDPSDMFQMYPHQEYKQDSKVVIEHIGYWVQSINVTDLEAKIKALEEENKKKEQTINACVEYANMIVNLGDNNG